MQEKLECKNGCVYYNSTKNNCEYPYYGCAIDDLPFYDTPKDAPKNKLNVSHK